MHPLTQAAIVVAVLLAVYWLAVQAYFKATAERRAEQDRQTQVLVEQHRQAEAAENARHEDQRKREQILAEQRLQEQRAAATQRQLAQLRPVAAEEFRLAQSMREFPAETLIAGANPEEFERLIGLLLEADGWDVRLTGRGPDNGVDAFWGKSGADIGAVQVKHKPTSRIGRPVVQQIIGVAASRGLKQVLIATSGEFTDTARRYKPRAGIHVILWDRDLVLSKIGELPDSFRLRIPRELPTAAAAVGSSRDRSDAIVTGAPQPPECHGYCELQQTYEGAYEWACTAPQCGFRTPVDPDLHAAIDAGAYPIIRWRWASALDTPTYRNLDASQALRRLNQHDREKNHSTAVRRPPRRTRSRRRWR